MRLGDLAATLGLALEGDPDLDISGLASLVDAGPGELAFVTGPRYRRDFEASRAGAVLAPPDFDVKGRPCLRSRAPYVDFARAIDALTPAAPAEPGVHAAAVVAPDAELGPEVAVGACAVIGAGARIGARTRIHPHVTVYPGAILGEDCEIHSGAHIRERVTLGDRVVVQNGAVIGSEGFGFAVAPDGSRIRVPHRAGVVVGDDVEVGANTTVDASHAAHLRFGHPRTATWIGRAVKIDNLVQVGHGVSVGDGTTLCALVGLAGGTEVGRNVFFAGQSASPGHVRVGDGAVIGGKCSPIGDVEPGVQMLGFPGMERRLWNRVAAAWKRLPELLRRVRRIEERLGIGADERDRRKGG